MASRSREFEELSDSELVSRLAETKEELFKLRFQHATGQLENTSRLRVVKLDIARCKTLVRAREIAAAEAAEGQN
mgnify:CR=1 FL=1